MSANHDIQLALRTAAGFERTAKQAEEQAAKTYEMKMKSAGASVFHAFQLALAEAPDFKGRKIDEKAIRRIYESNKPRPWWDAHLAAAKVEGKPATRDWAKRLIQWHIDPEAAIARHAKHVTGEAVRRKNLTAKRKTASRGARVAPSRAEAARVVAAAADTAHAGRELERLELAAPPETPLQDLLGELNRISSAVRKVKAAMREEALSILRAAARDIERYV